MPKTELTREDIVDLLYTLGASIVKNRETNDNIQFTCTVHGESNPSAGVSVSKQTFNCFSCHEGGSIPWLVCKSAPDDFKTIQQAKDFLSSRYGVEYSAINEKQVQKLKMYEDFINIDEEPKEKRFELPIFELAPYKSGKETYKYYYDRGFNKDDLQYFKVGRDLVSKTVTIPVFWQDGVLAGIIGRYIKPKAHNKRYKIYNNSPTGSFLYPLDKFKIENDTCIIVEGILDAMWLHKMNYTNCLATLTNNISKEQIELLKELGVGTIIDFTDNDKMGDIATTKLKSACLKNGIEYKSVKANYPEDKKDPQSMNEEELNLVISNVTGILDKPNKFYY